MASRNVETVKQIYESFMRGDTKAIIDRLREDVEFEQGVKDHGVPWLKHRKGKKDVEEFFRVLSDMETRKFEPRDFFEGENKVAATVWYEAKSKTTGREIRELDMHLFTFDNDGKVSAWRDFNDTHENMRAAGIEMGEESPRKRSA